jgi:hypothetical protein
LALRLQLRNSRASLRVRNGEAEEAVDAEEERLEALRIETSTTGIEVVAEAMHSMGGGVDGVRETAQAVVEDMLQRKAKCL